MQYKEREWQLEEITEMDLTRTKSESRFLVDEVVYVCGSRGMDVRCGGQLSYPSFCILDILVFVSFVS